MYFIKDDPGSGQGEPLSTTAKLTINIDKTNSKVPVPVFENPLYEKDYDVQTNKMDNIEISLQREYGLATTYDMSSDVIDVKNYFEFVDDTANIKLKTNLDPEFIKNYEDFTIIITATLKQDQQEQTGKTVAKINLKKESEYFL